MRATWFSLASTTEPLPCWPALWGLGECSSGQLPLTDSGVILWSMGRCLFRLSNKLPDTSLAMRHLSHGTPLETASDL